jgi:hypothetical protein
MTPVRSPSGSVPRMTTRTLTPVQLLLYEFGPEARFDGQLGGVLERFESAGALRILEAMFIQRDEGTNELEIIELRGIGAGGLISPVLDLRLDPVVRRRATQQALAASTSGIPRETLLELGSTLVPGAAVAALLIEHHWVEALDDAVEGTGGRLLVSEFVDAECLSELAHEVLAGAARASASAMRR